MKLFPVTVSNADIENLKSLQTFLQKCWYHMLVEFEQNRMVQTTQNFELLDKKPGFLNPFLTKRWRPFMKTFLAEKLFNAELLL